ncbi:hypothetical protein A2U01_0057247 [Trifolium medium]|uniref:Uncharacterized protein n=1 Tax=Trifolium medium TaxID=97028 RepID=A0A392RK71_9FABA|nr:hypothetical protein [Trifolium medium]
MSTKHTNNNHLKRDNNANNHRYGFLVTESVAEPQHRHATHEQPLAMRKQHRSAEQPPHEQVGSHLVELVAEALRRRLWNYH